MKHDIELKNGKQLLEIKWRERQMQVKPCPKQQVCKYLK